ncbi:class I glutamine amidotransferase-like protein [Agrocybe pediades]|nr:class I glutamine amidotransferase-like protein [Agrocybe pediades]
MSNPVWTFGVLLLPGYQLLDMAGPVDYLQIHSREFTPMIPDATSDILNTAPIIKWHFIAENLNPVSASSGPPLTPTDTFETAPKLDYLIVPGPDPYQVLPEATIKFVQKVFNEPSFQGLLTVCSGSMVIAQTGVLDGYKVCSNKVCLRDAAKKGLINHNVTWLADKRWYQDGKVWSASGVTAGIDLAAGFLATKLSEKAQKLAQDAAEYYPNPSFPDRFARILEGVKLN